MAGDHCQPRAIVLPEAPLGAEEWPQHLGAVLLRACTLAPRTEILSLRADAAPAVLNYASLTQQAMRILAGLRQLGMRPGDPLILQLDRVEEFLPVFWAAQFGGLLPAPLAVPLAYDAPNAACTRLEAAWEHLGRALVVAGSSNAVALHAFAAARPGFKVANLTDLTAFEPAAAMHEPAPDDPALLLFTSGSTGAAKAVTQTHRALIARSFGTIARHGFGPDDKSFNWFPLDHVGGLVMFHLLDTCALAAQVHAPTAWIIQDPLRWLEVLQAHAVTVTWAPNFAFGLINARKDDVARRQWDLSRVRHILNGGEAIVARTAREFLNLLAPHRLRADAMFPAWGMSETCSGVTYSDRFRADAADDADPFVEVGRPIPGFGMRIVDSNGDVLGESEIGQLEVSGAMVTCGYHGNPELNRAAFTADGWLRTGDNGFIADGRLTVTGRDKDEIIAHGANHHCYEIEKAVQEVPGVEPSFAAAIGIREGGSDTDQLVVFFVPADGDAADIARAVRRRVAEATGLFARHVIAVAQEDIPKTAIGKIQRNKLRQDFSSGKFAAAIARADAGPRTNAGTSAAEQAVARIWCEVLDLAAVAPEEQFFEIGGSSVTLVQVHARLEAEFGRRFSPVELFRFPTVRALARFLVSGAEQIRPARARRAGDAARDDIAVVGLACRFPGAPDIASFWHNLCDGIDSISDLTEAEIIAAGVPPQRARDPNWVKATPAIDAITDFDAEFFGMTVKEARLVDPQHRLFLECCWEALEDAGRDPLAVREPCGVFAGASLNTYFVNNVFPNRQRLSADGSVEAMNFDSMDGFQLMVTSDKDYLPTRVSFKLNLTGPSIAVQTACSTSLVAIHLACRSLLAGDCDMALAGGSTVKVPQDSGYLYAPGMMLSPDGRCRAFDAEARGTVFGNGVGVVALKRLADALADGDRVYAVVKGSAVSNDGGEKVGFTAPSEEGQFRAIADAIEQAGVPAETIGLVEAHGTGTELGDPIELAALSRAFRAGGGNGVGWCTIGSVKTNIGHVQHASGVAGFIKAVLALHHRRLLPLLHFSQPNPRLGLETSPFRVNTELAEWSAPGPLRAGVNSLGIGGTNCHVILEQAPEPPARETEKNPAHLLVLSARTDAALAAQAARFRARLADPTLDLGDACQTAAIGRHAFPHRLAVIGSDRAELAGALADPARWLRGTAATAPAVAWLFTGQGAQWFGMARELYATEPLVRGVLDRSQQVLADELDRPLLSIIFGDGDDGKLLNETAYTQPALYAVECALAALWLSWGLKPAAVIGHSVGEYAAAHVAGVLGLDEGLRLLAARGRLMQALPADGAMAAVSADEATVRTAIAGREATLTLAAVNGPASCVISGRADAVAAAAKQFAADGIRTQPLTVSHAFHSPLLDPMLEPFHALLERLALRPPTVPLISNLTGTIAGDEITTPDYWVRHAREPVRFADGVRTLVELGCTAWLEIGPKPTLLGLARASLGETAPLLLPSMRPGNGEWPQMLSSLGQLWAAGAPVDWQAVGRGREHRRVSLPTYPFERQRHWIEPPSAGDAEQPLPGGHPLLGRRLSTPLAEVPFAARIGLDLLPWLTDHRVHGEPVLPASAYLEAAVAGLAELTGDAGPVALSDVVFERPLVLAAEPISVQAVFSPAGDGVFSVAVHSSDGTRWQRHMTARVQSAAPGSAEAPDDCPNEVPVDRHFSRFAERGVDYGPAFRGLVALRSGGGRALGKIRAPQSIQSSLAQFRLHPALLDAALQVFDAAFPATTDRRPLLPVAIERMTVFAALEPELRCEAIARETPSNEMRRADLRLTTRDGRLIATVTGLTLKAATRASPIDDWFFHPVWQPQPLAAPDASPLPDPAATIAAMLPALQREVAAIPRAHHADVGQRDGIAVGFILAALDGLGVELRRGSRFTTAAMAERAGIVPEQRRLFARLFRILAEAGQIVAAGDGWLVPGERPPVRQPLAALAEFDIGGNPALALLHRCGPALAEVLTGRRDPVRDLLFSADDPQLTQRFYTRSPGFTAMNAVLGALLERMLTALPAGRRLEILEVGAGTGGTTAAILPALPPERVGYTFTDVSRAFVNAAEARFGGALRYRTLDIEQDPIGQGFAPGGFDLVIAANVLHATRDLAASLDHLRALLAPGGQMVLLEITRPAAWIDVTFGLTNGWWRFADTGLRRDYPLLTTERWRTLLAERGFAGATALGADQLDDAARAAIYHQSIIVAAAPAARRSGRWLVFADRGGMANRLARLFADPPILVCRDDPGPLLAALADADLQGVADLRPLDLVEEPPTGGAMDEHCREGLAGALTLVQALARQCPLPLVIVTRGAVAQAPLWGFAKVVALEHPELACRMIDLDPDSDDAAALFTELTTATDEDQVAWRAGERLVARLAGGRREAGTLRVPEADAYRLVSKGAGVESLALEPLPRRAPRPDEMEVRVFATGLNFRDVLSALGRYSGGPVPLGAECAGEVVRVGAGVADFRPGDRVMALAAGTFANFATFDARAAARIPEAIGYEEAATIPAAFVTAWHGLYELGALKPGDSVLIHAATGGVGQAAIQLARRIGATAYGTASRPKWEALRRLGVAGVFDSRSLDFADGLRDATGGRGVDVVLNSLGGEFIRKGLEVVAPGGHFVEIGRNEVWSPAEAAALRPDIGYHLLDLGDAAFSGARLRQVAACLAAGEIAPLPRQVFPVAEAPAAFRRMQRALHLGKLVVTQPQPLACQADAAYLITGGLGDLGLLTAEFLAERGARNLVLLGRGAATAASPRLDALRARGVALTLEAVDVADHDALAAVLARLQVPLRGVIHAAGALDDGVLAQLDPERFRPVTSAKIAGAWNLHLLTRGRRLDFFVLYGSAVSLFGAAGQANHAAANAFLDALAALRREKGLPGLCIDWGAWSETGAAVKRGVVDRLAARGLGAIDNAGGLAALERAMAEPAAQLGIVPIDWDRFLEARPHWPFIAQFRAAAERPALPRREALASLAEAVRSAPPDERNARLAEFVATIAARVLGHNDAKRVDRQAGFFDIGLDSLTTVELRVLLQNALAVELPVTVAFDYPTVEALAAELSRRLFPQAAPVSEIEAELASLPDLEVEAELRRELASLRY